MLLFVDIILGALQPWPLKMVIDYVLQHDKYPLPEFCDPGCRAATEEQPDRVAAALRHRVGLCFTR